MFRLSLSWTAGFPVSKPIFLSSRHFIYRRLQEVGTWMRDGLCRYSFLWFEFQRGSGSNLPASTVVRLNVLTPMLVSALVIVPKVSKTKAPRAVSRITDRSELMWDFRCACDLASDVTRASPRSKSHLGSVMGSPFLWTATLLAWRRTL